MRSCVVNLPHKNCTCEAHTYLTTTQQWPVPDMIRFCFAAVYPPSQSYVLHIHVRREPLCSRTSALLQHHGCSWPLCFFCAKMACTPELGVGMAAQHVPLDAATYGRTGRKHTADRTYVRCKMLGRRPFLLPLRPKKTYRLLPVRLECSNLQIDHALNRTSAATVWYMLLGDTCRSGL